MLSIEMITQQRQKEYEVQYAILSDKIERLQSACSIETDVTQKFKYQTQLQEAEQERGKLEAEFAQLELQKLALPDEMRVTRNDLLTIPEKLWDRYEKQATLGMGGLAEVFRVCNRHLNRVAALKVLLPKHRRDPLMIARFWAEGKIMGRLSNARQRNIVNVHNMGRSADGECFIEMEYVPGSTLDAALQQHGHFPPKIALRLLRLLADALRHAHDHRIIHRDIKPQNMIVDDRNRLTLMDFGLAKRLDSDSQAGMSQSGVFIGSYQYAAPEQFDQRTFGTISERSDIYAIGILGYQLLTGVLPFDGSPTQLMFGHCCQPLPDFPPELAIPSDVAELIAQCTQKQPADRFQSMQAVDAAIKRIMQTEGKAKTPTFQFESVTVDAKGNIITRTPGNAQYVQHDLGGGVMLDMVSIPGGTFLMGSPKSEKGRSEDESPQHQVTIASFWMGKYPVTQAQWQAVMGKKPSSFKGANRPVENVSWDDAQEFVKKLNAMVQQKPSFSEKLGFSLPSEAQWEYACRTGAQTVYCFGDDPAQLDEYAWYSDNSDSQTHPVGEKLPNVFGLYDMHGNVWEWCADAWHDNYNGAPTDGNIWVSLDDEKAKMVLRGGSWGFNSSFCRSAFRLRDTPDIRDVNVGFRVVASGGRALP